MEVNNLKYVITVSLGSVSSKNRRSNGTGLGIVKTLRSSVASATREIKALVNEANELRSKQSLTECSRFTVYILV